VVMENMLRGIPVVSSDSGGLKEAKSGTGYVIPVRTIDRYQAVFDEHAMPRPVVEENDPLPWVSAVSQLLTDREAYQRESDASRRAAQQFVNGLDASAMERFLCALHPREAAKDTAATIESLSPAKRALLLQRLLKRK